MTMDHIIQRGEFSKSFLGHEEAILIFDRATGYIDCFPVLKKDLMFSINALTEFRGLEYLHRIHTDGAKELKAACDQLGFFHTSSDAGNPKKNGVIENKVRLLKNGSRGALAQAGFPPNAWPWAVRQAFL